MPRPFFRLLLLLLLAGHAAAAPSTIGYQGRLATAGGTPVSASLSITFRLYGQASGGSALWSETQGAVDVDGGNFAVELGSVNAFPASLWGRQLYLGIEVAGDSEMLPRPALTASPYALRAASTLRRTIFVSAEGSPSENGSALLAAVAAITDASATSPVAVEIDAGVFDLGSSSLRPPAHTSLRGRGQSATLITSTNTSGVFGSNGATLVLASHSAASDLTARNTGVPAGSSDSTSGLAALNPAQFQEVVTGVRLQRVTGESIAAPGSAGQRAGISVCASDSTLVDITGRAEGGLFAMGLRADCAASTGLHIRGATLHVRAATDGLRGTYLAGDGVWRGLSAFIEPNPTVQTIFGIRVFANSSGGSAELADATIEIGDGDASVATQTELIDGLRVEYNTGVNARHLLVDMRRLRARDIAGVRLFGDILAERRFTLADATIGISAVQEAPLGFGTIAGIRLLGAAPELDQLRVQVRCLAGGYNPCAAVEQNPPLPNFNPGLQAGGLQLRHSRLSAGHLDPADSSATSRALAVAGSAEVSHSDLQVSRSADAETVAVLSLTSPSASLRVSQSGLFAQDPSASNAGCLLAGPAGASASLFGNHLQGARCDGGQVTATCVGNSARGSGFLASTCP